ncbi:heme o synthase [Anaerolineales bacterium HSG25]|nr:heme o synthase [Anaerolineales bacterium HSG25]
MMTEQISLNRFKQFTMFNAGWAVLVGWLTLTVYVLLDCADCQTSFVRWSEIGYMSSLFIGLILALIMIGWSWQQLRQHRLIVGTTVAIAGTVGGQLLLHMVTSAPSALVSIGQTSLLVTYLGLTVLVATRVSSPVVGESTAIVTASDRFYLRFLLLTAATVLTLILTGVALRLVGPILACSSWPLCDGQMLPFGWDSGMIISWLHRVSAVTVGIGIAGIVLQTRHDYQHLSHQIHGAMFLTALYLLQVLVGAFNVWFGWPIINILHLGLSLLMWSGIVALVASFYMAPKSTVMPSPTIPIPRKEKLILYFKLIKPWILILLLLTTITGMFMAARGLPSLWLMWFTFWGGVFSSGGASVLNSYIDSDIDGKMSRTSRRATATGKITPQETFVFGMTLGTLSIIIFAVFVNPLSTLLSTLGFVYYVFLYTMYLKRSTIHNIVVGGAAGAIPPLVGWAAVTGGLNLEAFYLFAIILFWTPPHTWALALLVEKDYARVKVPMLPVVVGVEETVYQTFLYTVLLVAITLLPFTIGMVGWLYLTVAVLLGAQFLRLAWQLWRNYDKAISKKLYKYSQRYLAYIFLIMAIDRMIF